MALTFRIAAFLLCVLPQAEALSGRLRLRQQPFTEDKDAETSLRPLSRPEKDAILQRLRDRKAALQRLALEDALGVEAQEQAQAESNVLSDLGGEPFIGVNEQKAKISVSKAAVHEAMLPPTAYRFAAS